MLHYKYAVFIIKPSVNESVRYFDVSLTRLLEKFIQNVNVAPNFSFYSVPSEYICKLRKL